MRPVNNVKPLNAHLKKKKFQMDTVMNLVKPIDLRKAYTRVSIFQKHRS